LGGAAPDLGYDGKGRELSRAAGTVILQDLGNLENRERGSVQSCAAASTLAGAVERAMLAAIRASRAVTILPVRLGGGEVASLRDEEGL
jgi:hypothetical protein